MSENAAPHVTEEIPNPFPDLALEQAELEAANAPEAPATSETEEVTPQVPEWSKPLQKMQQNLANRERQLDKRFDDMMELVKSIAERPDATPSQKQKSEYDEAMEFLESDQGKELETLNPGTKKLFNTALKAGNTVAKLEQKIAQLEKASETQKEAEFWAPYPEHIRKAVMAEEKRLTTEIGMTGDTLKGARYILLEKLLKDDADSALAAASPNRAQAQPKPGTVIPSSTGGRPAATINHKKVVESGVGGNLLGLPINFT